MSSAAVTLSDDVTPAQKRAKWPQIDSYTSPDSGCNSTPALRVSCGVFLTFQAHTKPDSDARTNPDLRRVGRSLRMRSALCVAGGPDRGPEGVTRLGGGGERFTFLPRGWWGFV